MENFLNLSVPSAIWCAAVLFLASYIRGFSGFGFTAVLMIGLSMLLPLAEIVPLSIALEIAASSGQARGILPDVNWRKLGVLLGVGLLGTPIGVYLLGAFPDASLRALALTVVMLASLLLVFSHHHPRQFSLPAYSVAGFIIGIVNGATALSGLVLALLLSLTSDPPAQLRATMIFYLFLADFWAGGILLASGFYDSVTAYRIVAALPVLTLGVWLGSRQFASSRPDRFRKAVWVLLLVLSASGLIMDLA